MNDTKNETRTLLADLLRGELAAVETYEQALTAVEGAPFGTRLQMFHDEHVRAVTALRTALVQYTTEVPTSSGSWGTFAKAVEGAAKLLGNTLALRALKSGEEHGVKGYEQALESTEIPGTIKTSVLRPLLGDCRSHVVELNGWIAAA
jgi:Domain of unknown function (DUF2383)